jgi:hypothetical protein
MVFVDLTPQHQERIQSFGSSCSSLHLHSASMTSTSSSSISQNSHRFRMSTPILKLDEEDTNDSNDDDDDDNKNKNEPMSTSTVAKVHLNSQFQCSYCGFGPVDLLTFGTHPDECQRWKWVLEVSTNKLLKRRKQRTKSADHCDVFMTAKYKEGRDGVRLLNPAWEAAREAHFAAADRTSTEDEHDNVKGDDHAATKFVLYPFVNRKTALPVVSYPSQENLFEMESEKSDNSHGEGDDDAKSDYGDDQMNTRAGVTSTSLYESALSDYRADWQVQALQEYEHLMTCNEHEDFESVPFTQATLADLLGYRLSLAEYEYYFDNFLEAQRKRLPTLEHYRKEFLAVLPKLYPEFRKVALASDIVEVRSYRRRIKAGAPIIKLTTRQAQESESPQSPRRWTRSTTQQSQDSDSPQPPRRLIRLLRENSLGRLFQGKQNKQAKRLSC